MTGDGGMYLKDPQDFRDALACCGSLDADRPKQDRTRPESTEREQAHRKIGQSLDLDAVAQGVQRAAPKNKGGR